MTKALSFTEQSLARAIRGVVRAGHHVIGVRTADGVLLVAEQPLDPGSLVPQTGENAPATSGWEDR